MSLTSSNEERIFYDGNCGVCHWSVRFVARHDPEGTTFRFAPLGGETFERIVPVAERHKLPDSLVVQTRSGELLLQSDGAVHILRRLGGFWGFVGGVLRFVPRPLRNAAYARFAAVRHRLVAKPGDACPLPSPELRSRLDA